MTAYDMRISDLSSDVCSSDLVTVARRRTAVDFAEQMRDLVDVGFPDADKIRVVMENLSTHTPGALYEAFPVPAAHRILSRLEFPFTPKHASWLNIAEFEIGLLSGKCLAVRLQDRQRGVW